MEPFRPRLIVTSAWSFGRDRRLASDLEELFVNHELEVVDLWSDPDLNRTEVAMMGPDRNMGVALFDACDLVLPAINLNRHAGTHPRIGALDLVRFEPIDEDAACFDSGYVFADFLGSRFALPVHYDGPSSQPGAEGRILRMREAGFGGLTDLDLIADFGPPLAHDRWGVTVVSVGPRQLAAWVDLADPTTLVAGQVAERLNELREQGDAVLLGVRAEGWGLPTVEGSRVGLTFEMPEITAFDEVIGFVGKEARLRGGAPLKAHARKGWLPEEAKRASRLVYGRRQVLEDVYD